MDMDTDTERRRTFEIDRRDHAVTRIAEDPAARLEDGQIRLAIDRFALSANNITYALVGDQLGYWSFFPAEAPWGRIPAMGWADVVESRNSEIRVGGRYFGWYPMASGVTLSAAPHAAGFRDVGPHRDGHAPIYRLFQSTERDPYHRADFEDRDALLRGLFLTAFLADDYLEDQDYFGTATTIVLSASSKTAIGLAAQSRARGRRTIGLTSPANLDFVRSLALYDQTLSYEQLEDDAFDPDGYAVVVDMSGRRDLVARVHERLGGRLRYSMAIGMSHGAGPERAAAPKGARASSEIEQGFFFAPTQAEKRNRDWGPRVVQERMTAALHRFVEESEGWLEIEEVRGPESLGETYRALRAGQIRPERGLIASLSPPEEPA
ncbi:MAG: DUF2855 family protein [Acidobacteriota bacterium]